MLGLKRHGVLHGRATQGDSLQADEKGNFCASCMAAAVFLAHRRMSSHLADARVSQKVRDVIS